MRVYRVLVLLLACLQIAAKAPVDFVIEFEVPAGDACAVGLTQFSGVYRDYAVTHLDVPSQGPASLVMRAISLMTGVQSLGQAGQLTAGGVWNTFKREDGVLLRAFVEEGSLPDRGYGPAFALGRAARSPEELDLTRHALNFVEGRAPGRGYWLDLNLPMRGSPLNSQSQSVIILLPDHTYPRGVMISAHASLPTHRYLANFFWPNGHAPSDGGREEAALIHSIRVRESARNRMPSYRPGPPPVRPGGPESNEPFVKSVTVE